MSLNHLRVAIDPVAPYLNIGCNTLSVAGAATIGGLTVGNNIVVAGNVTATGNVFASGNVTAMNMIATPATLPVLLGGTANSAVGSLTPCNIGVFRTIFAALPASGGNTITQQSGGIATVAHTNASGVYVINYPGIFGANPYIQLSLLSVVGGGYAVVSGISPTSCTINTLNASNVLTDYSFNISISGVTL